MEILLDAAEFLVLVHNKLFITHHLSVIK